MGMETCRVAVSGGGIASLCLAQALAEKRPDMEVKVFEASATLRDEGAAIGLGPNAQEALALLQLREVLDDAGGTTMEPSARIMMGTGPHSGELVKVIESEPAQIVVHRGSFWKELAKRIQPGVLQMGRRLVQIACSDEEGPIQLYFEDGSSYEADVVIGCDGITSITRQAVLGGDHPAARPVYGTGYNHRVVIPIEEAKEAFGEAYCSMRTQHGWVGDDGGFLVTDFLDDGRSMQVIAGWGGQEAWPFEQPYVEWPKDRLRFQLSGWGDIGKAMTKVFMAQPKVYAAGSRMHLDTPTYCKGCICIAGDAALSFPPFKGAGAGQAIEDALMLSTVLGACSAISDVPSALAAYDALRRPRRTMIAEGSKWAATLLTGRDPEAGVDIESIARKLENFNSEIHNYDLREAQAEALELINKLKIVDGVYET